MRILWLILFVSILFVGFTGTEKQSTVSHNHLSVVEKEESNKLLDTITNWQFYKDSELLFKSNEVSSDVPKAVITKNAHYKKLSFSIFYDFYSMEDDRRMDFVIDGETIASFEYRNSSRERITIPKKENNKLIDRYPNSIADLIYFDSINESGLLVGRISFSD